ncbi:hypothetical protein PT2222_140038 [Paraburkholderia tropica]
MGNNRLLLNDLVLTVYNEVQSAVEEISTYAYKHSVKENIPIMKIDNLKIKIPIESSNCNLNQTSLDGNGVLNVAICGKPHYNNLKEKISIGEVEISFSPFV